MQNTTSPSCTRLDRMNESRVLVWPSFTTSNANRTATTACPTIFVVLFNPSDRCRRIFR